MRNIDRQELQATLQQLDQAIYHHEQWRKELTRSLICRLPCDERDTAEDAHRQCRFGQWYYGAAQEALRDHPAFAALETEHRRLHQLAAQLLLAAARGPVSARDHDNFTDAADRLQMEMQSLRQELQEPIDNRDPITGAENLGGMLTRLRELQELVKRGVQECGIVIMDMDHFKRIDHRYGHPAGDRVLVAWVSYIKAHLRPYDRIYRYGGEEFLLSLPGTNLEAVAAIIERLRSGISAIDMGVDGTGLITGTASFGITMLAPDVSVEEAISRANAALHAARQAGHDRSRIWDETLTPVRGKGIAVTDLGP